MYATVASMIDLFNMDNIKILQDLGYQVDVAANFEQGNVTSKERISEFKKELDEMNVNYYHIPIPRSISNLKDLKKSYNMTVSLKNKKKYELVHCHTPIGSAICRLAFRDSMARVIYTAHGFHFYKGAPLKNWLVYYPVEKWLSRYTDTLITINHEDYNNSKKLHSKKNNYVPGVGVDLTKYSTLNNYRNLKEEIGLSKNDILLFSIGELNKNKNHGVVLKAIAKIKNKNIHYLIAGQGSLEAELYELANDLKIFDQLHLLGYRKNIPELLKEVDAFIFPSLREGLSASLMEAMASGLPIIASDIRGNIDLIDNNIGGYLLDPYDIDGFSEKIEKLCEDNQIREKFGLHNRNKVKNFSNLKVKKIMEKIYLDN